MTAITQQRFGISGQRYPTVLVAHVGSGTLILGGSASESVTWAHEGAGEIAFSGGASSAFIPATIPVQPPSGGGAWLPQPKPPKRPKVRRPESRDPPPPDIWRHRGKAISPRTVASAAHAVSWAHTGNASLAFSGHASVSVAFVSAAVVATPAVSGGATSSVTWAHAGSGSLGFAGTAQVAFVVAHQGGGNVAFAGSAQAAATWAHVGNGTLAIGGGAATTFTAGHAGRIELPAIVADARHCLAHSEPATLRLPRWKAQSKYEFSDPWAQARAEDEAWLLTGELLETLA